MVGDFNCRNRWRIALDGEEAGERCHSGLMSKVPRSVMANEDGVGTLKDGYVHNVPLPRAPQIQSASPMTSHESIAPKAGYQYLVTYMSPVGFPRYPS